MPIWMRILRTWYGRYSQTQGELSYSAKSVQNVIQVDHHHAQVPLPISWREIEINPFLFCYSKFREGKN